MFKFKKLELAIIVIAIIYLFFMVRYMTQTPVQAAQQTGDYSRCFGTNKHHSRCKNLNVNKA